MPRYELVATTQENQDILDKFYEENVSGASTVDLCRHHVICVGDVVQNREYITEPFDFDFKIGEHPIDHPLYDYHNYRCDVCQKELSCLDD